MATLVAAIAIIVIGHIVTIPTAMAVAEIATNQKVEGGGAYYIISRSFGLNIGAAIGIALFLAQAISVAFYVVAFAEAFDPIIDILFDEDPRAYIDAIAKLMNYAIPKLSATEIKKDTDTKIEINLNEGATLDDIKKQIRGLEDAEDIDYTELDE